MPILEAVAARKLEGLTGETLLRTFFRRMIQPLRLRVLPMWAYTGLNDLSHESAVELPESEVNTRVRSMLDTLGLDHVGDQPAPLAANTPSTRVSSQLCLRP